MENRWIVVKGRLLQGIVPAASRAKYFDSMADAISYIESNKAQKELRPKNSSESVYLYHAHGIRGLRFTCFGSKTEIQDHIQFNDNYQDYLKEASDAAKL